MSSGYEERWHVWRGVRWPLGLSAQAQVKKTCNKHTINVETLILVFLGTEKKSDGCLKSKWKLCILFHYVVKLIKMKFEHTKTWGTQLGRTFVQDVMQTAVCLWNFKIKGVCLVYYNINMYWELSLFSWVPHFILVPGNTSLMLWASQHVCGQIDWAVF